MPVKGKTAGDGTAVDEKAPATSPGATVATPRKATTTKTTGKNSAKTASSKSAVTKTAKTSPSGTRRKAAPNGDGTRLVIVESPAKARTIAGYLGKGYVVESSIGHIRDMPDKAAEIPAKYKSEPWARLGVDVNHDFEALYVVHSDKRQQVSKLKSLLKDADELLLATDEDREGEAIAWHLLEELKPKVPTKRMVFHEITPDAIHDAVNNPRELRPWPGGRLSDPAHSGPALRLRGLAGAVAKVCRGCPPAGCSPWPPGSSWTASASGSRSGRRSTGT